MRGVPTQSSVKTEVVERYGNGDSIRLIAKELELSYGTVWNILHEAKIKMRARGGANRSV